MVFSFIFGLVQFGGFSVLLMPIVFWDLSQVLEMPDNNEAGSRTVRLNAYFDLIRDSCVVICILSIMMDGKRKGWCVPESCHVSSLTYSFTFYTFSVCTRHGRLNLTADDDVVGNKEYQTGLRSFTELRICGFIFGVLLEIRFVHLTSHPV